MNAFASPTIPPFPVRATTRPPLVLPRRSRNPSGWSALAPTQPAPAEPLNQQQEEALAERERLVAEAEARLADRMRDLDEIEALLRAREALLDSARSRESGKSGVVTLREAEALRRLQEELERQEASLRESRQALKERERYLEESEARLFEKVQQQQEKETELEQREEELHDRLEREGGQARNAAPKPRYDEFKE